MTKQKLCFVRLFDSLEDSVVMVLMIVFSPVLPLAFCTKRTTLSMMSQKKAMTAIDFTLYLFHRENAYPYGRERTNTRWNNKRAC